MNDGVGRWVLLAFAAPLVLWAVIWWPDLLFVGAISVVLIPDAWRQSW